jgi:hypothetical protein
MNESPIAATQNVEPTRPIFITSPAPHRPHFVDDDTPIRAGSWHNTRYHTNGYMTESRLLALLRNNAFGIKERVGAHTTRNIRDYQVTPSLLEAFCRAETLNLEKWTAPKTRSHRPGFKLTGAALKMHQNRLEREAREGKSAPTDGKEASSPQLAGGEQKAQKTRNRMPGSPSLEANQVEQIRRATAAVPKGKREARLKLYGELGTQLGRHAKVISDCAEGRTYRHLPLTESYATGQAKKRGRKSKAESQPTATQAATQPANQTGTQAANQPTQ